MNEIFKSLHEKGLTPTQSIVQAVITFFAGRLSKNEIARRYGFSRKTLSNSGNPRRLLKPLSATGPPRSSNCGGPPFSRYTSFNLRLDLIKQGGLSMAALLVYGRIIFQGHLVGPTALARDLAISVSTAVRAMKEIRREGLWLPKPLVTRVPERMVKITTPLINKSTSEEVINNHDGELPQTLQNLLKSGTTFQQLSRILAALELHAGSWVWRRSKAAKIWATDPENPARLVKIALYVHSAPWVRDPTALLSRWLFGKHRDQAVDLEMLLARKEIPLPKVASSPPPRRVPSLIIDRKAPEIKTAGEILGNLGLPFDVREKYVRHERFDLPLPRARAGSG